MGTPPSLREVPPASLGRPSMSPRTAAVRGGDVELSRAPVDWRHSEFAAEPPSEGTDRRVTDEVRNLRDRMRRVGEIALRQFSPNLVEQIREEPILPIEPATQGAWSEAKIRGHMVHRRAAGREEQGDSAPRLVANGRL